MDPVDKDDMSRILQPSMRWCIPNKLDK
jgi:hypothetical protein